VARGRAFGRSLPAGQYLELSFTELTQAPDHTLRKILDFVGEEWDSALLEHTICPAKPLRYVASRSLNDEFLALSGSWREEFGWPRNLA